MSGDRLHIRPAHGLDTRDMAAILTRLIEIGGTTAITGTVDAAAMADWMQRGGERSAWHVAEDGEGQLLGFQLIEPTTDLPPEAVDIATFVAPGRQGLGVGSGLFRRTEAVARALGYGWINANIRADNAGGLAYYQSRGFEDWGQQPNRRLGNGQIVTKIFKRYDLT